MKANSSSSAKDLTLFQDDIKYTAQNIMGTLVFTFFRYHKKITAHKRAPLVEFIVILITDVVNVLRIQIKNTK
jgi:hypothetical protein